MVGHKIDDDTEFGIMCALYECFKLLHALGFILRQIRIDIVVIGDCVRRSG